MSRIPLPSNFSQMMQQAFNTTLQEYPRDQLAKQQLAQQALQHAQDLAVRKQLLASQLQRAADVHNQILAQQKSQQAWNNYLQKAMTGGQAPPAVTPTSMPADIGTGVPFMRKDQYAQELVQHPQLQAQAQQSLASDPNTMQTTSAQGQAAQQSVNDPYGQLRQFLQNPITQIRAMQAGVKLPTIPETQQEKLQQAVEIARARAQATQEARTGDMPSRQTITNAQTVVQATKNILPDLNDMIAGKHKFGITDISRDKRADYYGQIKSMADQILKINGLSSTNENLAMMMASLERQTGETYPAYINRLKGVRDKVLRRYDNAADVIRTHKVSTPDLHSESTPDLSKLSNAELEKIAEGKE